MSVNKKATETNEIPVRDLQAIDVHAHYGTELWGEKGVPAIFMRADTSEVVRRARLANIRLTIVSPLQGLMPRFGADPVAGNEQALRDISNEEGLMQWVIVDPLKEQTYRQAEEILSNPQCAGIKIHPEEHGYHIKSHGAELFRFAAQHKAIVMTHSGEDNSKPEDFLPFINSHPEVTLILAHLGCSSDDDRTHQVRAIENGKYDNIFVDTSSAANIFPGLLEWAVDKIGAEKILFGTDSPLYFEPMQRARIDSAEIPAGEKRKILRDNAQKLFGLDYKM